jgi:hypothetical protein
LLAASILRLAAANAPDVAGTSDDGTAGRTDKAHFFYELDLDEVVPKTPARHGWGDEQTGRARASWKGSLQKKRNLQRMAKSSTVRG